MDIPPVLIDQSDQQQAAILPPPATRQLLPYYEFAWIGVRLAHGTAGIGALQRHLAALATSLQQRMFRATHQKPNGLTFAISRSDVTRSEVQQAIRPQAVALAVFGTIAAAAMLVLVGQGCCSCSAGRHRTYPCCAPSGPAGPRRRSGPACRAWPRSSAARSSPCWAR
ncbi:MAG TPA: hypothetical protein VMH35_00545 [Streptosporangiaceae bacterium]|nr:hypothetical protein [Streptosporangiaceae bacterium]